MADDVGVLEPDEADTLDGREGLDGFDQAGFAMLGKVDLGGISGNDALGVGSEPGKEHEHLFGGGVLAFVENDEGAGEGAAAHVSERGDFEDALIHHLLDLLHIEHVVQGVVERTEVGKDFFLQIAGEKAESFAGLDGGAGEDDAVDLVGLEVGDSHGHGEVGFAGAGGSKTEDEVVTPDFVDVGFLEKGFRNDDGFFSGDLDAGGPDALELLAITALDGLEGVKEFVPADAEAVLVGEVELPEQLLGRGDGAVGPVDLQLGIAGGEFDPEGGFRLAKEGFVGGVEFREGVGVLEGEGLGVRGVQAS